MTPRAPSCAPRRKPPTRETDPLRWWRALRRREWYGDRWVYYTPHGEIDDLAMANAEAAAARWAQYAAAIRW